MPIKEKSILKNLPWMEDEKRMLLLDSVRFSAEMTKISFQSLKDTIESISEESSKKNLPKLFLFAWNCIDHSQRLLKLISKADQNYKRSRVDELIEFLRMPRNTYQHLNERVDKVLINNRSPFFGKLKWCYSYDDDNFANYVAISGAHFSRSHSFSSGEYSNNKITNIILETVNRKNVVEVNLSELESNLILLIKDFENYLKQDFHSNILNPRDRTGTSDILLVVKQKD